jgi:hypothetical protein
MNRASLLIAFAALFVSGCGGARLSHDEIRKQIAEIGGSTLNPKSVAVRRVVSQSGNTAIAETTVELAVQFERSSSSSPWRIAAVRLGDQDWVSLPELITALNEGRRRETTASLEKLATGIASYRRRNGGSAPIARDIVTLTDVLHPNYMTDLVRLDAWGNPIQYEVTGSRIQLRSFGADGVPGTADDVVLPEPGQ